MAGESELIIREVTGQERVLTLRGAALPFRGAPWGATLRTETTWYPGNGDEATQQVLGPTEKESDWTGMWSTTMLVRSASRVKTGTQETIVNQAFALRKIIEDIFRRGQLLRVVWTNKGEDVVREGRCIDWDFSYDRVDDIAWRMKFAWKGRGRRQQKVVQFRREDPVAGLNDVVTVGNEVLTFTEFRSSLVSSGATRLSANQFTLGQLENLANAPSELVRDFARKVQQIVGRVDRLGGIVKKFRAMPFQLANQAVDQAQNTLSVTTQFLDDMSRRPPEQNSLDVKVSNLSRTAEFFGESQAEARKLRDSAYKLRQRVQSQEKERRTILAVHIARGGRFGEQLTRISVRYYETPDRAPDIARANLLPEDQQFVPRGTVVIIPTLDAIRAFSKNG